MKKLLLLLSAALTALAVSACGASSPASQQPAPQNTAAEDGHKAVLVIDGSRLPVTLSFKDFSGMEKIAYFDKRLDEKGQKVGCHPLAGDLCVYQPWGNLSIFYVDFKDDSNLIPIGRLESGLDIVKAHDSFTATLEKAE